MTPSTPTKAADVAVGTERRDGDTKAATPRVTKDAAKSARTADRQEKPFLDPVDVAVSRAANYSLLPGDVLLFGNAETVARHDSLFAPLEREHRIFQRRDGPRPILKLPVRTMQNGSATSQKAGEPPASRTDWVRTVGLANNRVLERFASPFVVVTRDGTLMHYSSHVGGVLQPALGPPSRSVFEMARRSLR